MFKKYDDLNEIVEENVSSIRVVKSYVLEEKEKEKFSKTSNEIYKDFKIGSFMYCLKYGINSHLKEDVENIFKTKI